MVRRYVLLAQRGWVNDGFAVDAAFIEFGMLHRLIDAGQDVARLICWWHCELVKIEADYTDQLNRLVRKPRPLDCGPC